MTAVRYAFGGCSQIKALSVHQNAHSAGADHTAVDMINAQNRRPYAGAHVALRRQMERDHPLARTHAVFPETVHQRIRLIGMHGPLARFLITGIGRVTQQFFVIHQPAGALCAKGTGKQHKADHQTQKHFDSVLHTDTSFV